VSVYNMSDEELIKYGTNLYIMEQINRGILNSHAAVNKLHHDSHSLSKILRHAATLIISIILRSIIDNRVHKRDRKCNNVTS